MTASQKQDKTQMSEYADEIRSLKKEIETLNRCLKCEQEISRKLQERIDQIDFGEK